MTALHKHHARRRAFTLIEMMLVMAIIAILTGFVLAAVAGARAGAQIDGTRSLVTRLNSRLMAKWDSYRFRRLPVDLNVAAVRKGLATNLVTAKSLAGWQKIALRMEVIWDLQRIEMPDQWTDIDPYSIAGLTTLVGSGPPTTFKTLITPPPAALATYQRIFKATVLRKGGSFDPRNDEYQSAECLYLIMTVGLGEDALSAEELAGNVVGDKDGDGFFEFHDAWGEPIRFMRWPHQYVSDAQPMRLEEGEQIRDPGVDPDPLDHAKIFQPARASTPPHYVSPYYGFRLTPLIESGGPDKTFSRTYSVGQSLNDDGSGGRWDDQVYVLRNGSNYTMSRARFPYNGENGKSNVGDSDWIDNINNHQSGAK